MRNSMSGGRVLSNYRCVHNLLHETRAVCGFSDDDKSDSEYKWTRRLEEHLYECNNSYVTVRPSVSHKL